MLASFFNLGSFSYTPQAGFIVIWGVTLTHPMLASFLSGEFLLQIPCWLHFYVGSFSCTSNAGFSFPFFLNLGSLSYTSRASIFLCGEFLLHIPCWLHFHLGSFSNTSHARFSFSYTSCAGFTLISGLCLMHPMLFSFLSR